MQYASKALGIAVHVDIAFSSNRSTLEDVFDGGAVLLYVKYASQTEEHFDDSLHAVL